MTREFSRVFERILIISPHYDDETIGCGGFINRQMRLCESEIKVVFVSTSMNSKSYLDGSDVNNSTRYQDALSALNKLGVLPKDVIHLQGYDEGSLDTGSIKNMVGDLDRVINSFKPTTVLFPYTSHHQDHQVVHKASVAAVRPKAETNFIELKAMYEYPYITGWNDSVVATSKLHVKLDEEDIIAKRKALNKYMSQLARDPRDPLNIESIIDLAKTRGREVGEYYAEAYYIVGLKV